MSHSHLHAPKTEAQVTPKFWLLVTLVMGACLLLVLFVAAGIRDRAFDTSHLTAEGKISDIRIVVDHTVESSYGGRILYRIDAHVSYRALGQTQDRWMTASEVTPIRESLEMKLARHPIGCQVYWAPGHPENAKCRLE